MAVDRKWVERNLGFDPIAKADGLQREIIDFDSDSPAGLQFLAYSTATGLSRHTDIPWPETLASRTGPGPRRRGARMKHQGGRGTLRDHRKTAFAGSRKPSRMATTP